jgi:hypothetical protein
MNSCEQAIDKVLAGLRDCEAPPGFERRILEALEDRESAKSASRGRGRNPLGLLTPARWAATQPWAWRVVLAGILAVSVAITAIRPSRHVSTQSKVHAVPAGSFSQEVPGGVAQNANLRPNNPIAPITHVGNKKPARNARLIASTDSVSLREMRAASHPAPQAPLTQEEKLLLRIVHAGDPQQMAMLNPEIRARQEAENEAEFQEFVEQSDKVDRK